MLLLPAYNGSSVRRGTPKPERMYFLDVFGTTKDGIQLEDYFYVFSVN